MVRPSYTRSKNVYFKKFDWVVFSKKFFKKDVPTIYLYFFFNSMLFLANTTTLKLLLDNRFKKNVFFIMTTVLNTRYNWCTRKYKIDLTKYFFTINNEHLSEEFLHFNEFNTSGFFDFNDKRLVVRNCVALKRTSSLFKLKFSLNVFFFRKLKYYKFNQSNYNRTAMFKFFNKKLKKNFDFDLVENVNNNNSDFLNNLNQTNNNYELNIGFKNVDYKISSDLNNPSSLHAGNIFRKHKFGELQRSKVAFIKSTLSKYDKNIFDVQTSEINDLSLYDNMFFRKNYGLQKSEKDSYSNDWDSFIEKTTVRSKIKTKISKKRKRRSSLWVLDSRKIKNKNLELLDTKGVFVKNETVPDTILDDFYNKKKNFFFPNYEKSEKYFSDDEFKKVTKTKFRYYSKSKRPSPMSFPKTRYKKRFKFTLLKNRLMLANFLNRRVKYQRKFSVFLKGYIKQSFKSFFLFYEFSLSSVLLRSQFFFGVKDVNFFIKNNLIYVNGSPVNNPLKILKESDRVNFIFNKNYFFYYRKMMAFVKSDFFKLKEYKALRKSRSQNYHYSRTKKPDQPSWTRRYGYYGVEVPSFLEIDYLTMTIIIVYEPKHYYEFNKNTTKFVNFYQRHLYNWRYII